MEIFFEKDILVVDGDNSKGYESKIKVHKNGQLHRAYSFIILNSKKEILLQRRSLNKHHSGGLWSNTCCSHQKMGDEDLEKSAHDRLFEEMGIRCNLKKILDFKYNIKLNNGITENEIDHVFLGYFNGNPKINRDEVMDFKWMSLTDLKKDLEQNAERYSYWFKEILTRTDFFKDFLSL